VLGYKDNKVIVDQARLVLGSTLFDGAVLDGVEAALDDHGRATMLVWKHCVERDGWLVHRLASLMDPWLVVYLEKGTAVGLQGPGTALYVAVGDILFLAQMVVFWETYVLELGRAGYKVSLY